MSTETWFGNIERKVLGILHVLEKIHQYCVSYNISVKTDDKPLVAIYKKDVASLSQRLQRLLLHIHQYNMRLPYKHRPQLFIADWLPRHKHETNRDEEILELNITINVRVMHGDTLVHYRRNWVSNYRWWEPKHAIRICIAWLAINESWSTEGNTAILFIPRWNCGNSWNCLER